MGSDRHPEATQVARRFGRYLIERELGRGSYGVVYQACPDGGGDPVAIKVLLHPDRDADAVARFQQEAAIAARLSHPGLVRVLDAGWQSGHPWMAMEYCPGITLQKRIREGGPLPPPEAAQLMAEVARAVAYAHDQQVIHRDLKPSNVILDERTGRARVTDFGLARDRAMGVSITATGEALGTPYYMSPEQVRAQKDLDARADVWSLGVILYECLTGKRPFAARTSFLVAQEIIRSEPAPPSSLREGIAPALEAVCMRCLRKERSERFASAGALAFALEAAAGASLPSLLADGSLVRAATTPRGPSRLAMAAALLVLAAGGGVVGALLALRRPPARTAQPARAEAPPPASPLAPVLAPEERQAAVEARLRAAGDPKLPLAELLRRAEEATLAAGDDAGLQARVRLWRADRLLRRGRAAEARALVDSLLQRADRLGLEARFLRALCLEEEGQDARAEQEFDALAAADPEGALGLCAAARAECSRDEGVGAEVLPRAVALEPDAWQVRITWAWSLMRRGQLEEAGAVLARLEQERPDDVGVWVAASALAERRNDGPGREHALDRAFEAGGAEPPRTALLRRAGLSLATNPSAARADAEAILRRYPGDLNGTMLRALSDAIERRGDVDPATRASLMQLYRSDPERYERMAVQMGVEVSDALLILGGWRIPPPPATGELPARLRTRLARRAAQAPPAARGALHVALEAAAGGAPAEEVLAKTAQAVAAAPTDPVVTLEVARIYCGRDAGAALAAVGSALAAAGAPPPPELLRLRGEALVRGGQTAEGIKALEAARDADPRGPDGLCAGAQALFLSLFAGRRDNRGEGDAGRREDDPRRMERWALMSRARDMLRQALDGWPDHAPSLLALAASGERWSPASAMSLGRRVLALQGQLDGQVLVARSSALWEILVEGGKQEEARAEALAAVALSQGPWPAWRAAYRAMGGRGRGGAGGGRGGERGGGHEADPVFAARMITEALRRDAGYAPALQLRGVLALRAGAGKEEVLQLWRAARERDPSPISWRWTEEFVRELGDDPALDELTR